jgi:hypothetical protein
LFPGFDLALFLRPFDRFSFLIQRYAILLRIREKKALQMLFMGDFDLEAMNLNMEA